MGSGSLACDRVIERRRAVALTRHFREAESLSNVQIAHRLGCSPATIKAYFYDPTGEKARAVKARYVGVCRGCEAYTQPRNSSRTHAKQRGGAALERLNGREWPPASVVGPLFGGWRKARDAAQFGARRTAASVFLYDVW
jgi:hypothetical protein